METGNIGRTLCDESVLIITLVRETSRDAFADTYDKLSVYQQISFPNLPPVGYFFSPSFVHVHRSATTVRNGRAFRRSGSSRSTRSLPFAVRNMEFSPFLLNPYPIVFFIVKGLFHFFSVPTHVPRVFTCRTSFHLSPPTRTARLR